MKKNNFLWAFKTLILSISLSIVFSFISQSLFPKLSIFWSIFVILFFIVVSVIFDMISVAVTSISENEICCIKGKRGHQTATKLCHNTEKVSSFCGDVVGDICGILSGAGGVSLVLNIPIQDSSMIFVVTCLVSSLIAGLTIFGKAIMKNYAMENCKMVVVFVSKVMETSPFELVKITFARAKKLLRKSKKRDLKENKKEF